MTLLTYPHILFAEGVRVHPLANTAGTPFHLDLSDSGGISDNLDPMDPVGFQKWLDETMGTDYGWGMGDYLESRATLLRHFPQMQEEGRCYHLGVDIVLPEGTALHAPLTGTVVSTGYEPGDGNYGGYLMVAHDLPGAKRFYTFYGHLEPDSVPPEGVDMAAGDEMALTGGFSVNGNWFYHTHLQIITELGLREGYDTKGYCSVSALADIRDRCPDPLPLLCFSGG